MLLLKITKDDKTENQGVITRKVCYLEFTIQWDLHQYIMVLVCSNICVMSVAWGSFVKSYDITAII